MEYIFKILIHECREGGFFAECPILPGCHAEGDSQEEITDTMEKLINVFLKIYKKNNFDIPADNFSVSAIRIDL